MKPISKVACFRAKPGREARLGDALLALVEPTYREPGNLRYEIYQDEDQPVRWIVQEDWRSSADFDFHMAQPYVLDFLSDVLTLCEAEPEIRTYTPRFLSLHVAAESEARLGERSSRSQRGE